MTREAKLLRYVKRIARMNWDGEERLGEADAEISNDDYHETMIALIEEARTLVEENV